MDQGPLVKEEIEAGAQLAREFDRFAPVKVAFWLKEADDPYRYLHLASDRIDEIGLDMAYAEILRILAKIDSPDLDPFRIKVIGGDEPRALAALKFANSLPKARGMRLNYAWFGDRSSDDAYIYPLPLPVAAS
jgi:hypothetical protein